MKIKKLLCLSMILILLFSLTGCGNNNDDKGTENNTVAENKEDNVIENNNEEESKTDSETTKKENKTETNQSTAAEIEDNCISWDAIKVYFPGYFEEVEFATYKGTLPNGQKAYFLYDANIYHESNNSEDFNEVNVPDILDYTIYNKIEEIYPCYESKYSVSVETEESVEVLGCPFLYRTGVIHTEESDTSADLYYAAYYGVVHIDVYDVEKAPICWMAFSESDDPETLKELEKIVKNTAEKAEFEVY